MRPFVAVGPRAPARPPAETGYPRTVGNIAPYQIIILLVIALLLFGAKRLPEIGRSLGTGMREFKNSVTGKDDEPAQLPPAQAVPPVVAPPVQQTPVPPAEQ
ncbi:MAG: sec-independent protein translocase protein TatA [Gaiellaceae bacterium]|nr:sec-independent protein translocase protein TatA [Gaiellaceae bacterium]